MRMHGNISPFLQQKGQLQTCNMPVMLQQRIRAFVFVLLTFGGKHTCLVHTSVFLYAHICMHVATLNIKAVLNSEKLLLESV